jgi:hypothetical protein
VFGSPIQTDTGGYFLEAAVTRTTSSFLEGMGRTLLDPERGVLVYSRFLLVLVPSLPTAWRRAPDWVKGAAIGGIVYMLVQFRGNAWQGGAALSPTATPSSPSLVAAPLLSLAGLECVPSGMLRRITLTLGVLASIALYAYGAITS